MSTPTLVAAAASTAVTSSLVSGTGTGGQAIAATYAKGTELVAFAVTNGSTSGALTIADSGANTWTKQFEIDNTAGAAHTLTCWTSPLDVAALTATGPSTVTVSRSGGTGSVAFGVVDFTGSAGLDTTSSPIFQTASSTTATTSASVSGLGIAAGSILLMGLARSVSGAVTPGTNMTSLIALTAVGSSNRFLDILYNGVGTSGSIPATATFASGPYSAGTIALLAAAGGGYHVFIFNGVSWIPATVTIF